MFREIIFWIGTIYPYNKYTIYHYNKYMICHYYNKYSTKKPLVNDIRGHISPVLRGQTF